MNLLGFDWGWMDEPSDTYITDRDGVKKQIGDYHKDSITKEIFQDKLYEKYAEVKEDDIVIDIGASVGPFTYSILDKNPSKVICVEPSSIEHPTLEKNVLRDNVSIIKKALGSVDGKMVLTEIFGSHGQPLEIDSIRFDTLVRENHIEKVDFLKTDCEGGEYDIFSIDNLIWLKQNLGVAVGEWHLSTPELKQKFREFRDVFLRVFPNHQIQSVDNCDIKWDLWNEHFIEYYNEVIIFIDNRK